MNNIKFIPESQMHGGEFPLSTKFNDIHLENLVQSLEENEQIDIYVKIGSINGDYNRTDIENLPFLELKQEEANEIQLNHIQHFLNAVKDKLREHNISIIQPDYEHEIDVEIDGEIDVEIDGEIDVEIDGEIDVEIEKPQINPPTVLEVNEQDQHRQTRIELSQALDREQSLININAILKAQLGACHTVIEQLKTPPVPAPKTEPWRVKNAISQVLMRSTTVSAKTKKNHL